MAITYATISGRLIHPSDLGANGVAARLYAIPQTAGEAIPFAGDGITWGPAVTDTAADGAFASLTVPIAPGVVWKLVAEPRAGRLRPWLVGLFEILASGRLDALVPLDPLVVSPSVLDTVSASAARAEAAAAEAEAAADRAEDAAGTSAGEVIDGGTP